MKARWLLITILLAFPFACAFFLREARLGEKRPTKPALVVAPLPAPAPAANVVEAPAATTATEPSAAINPTSPAPGASATSIPPPSDEQIVELAGTHLTPDEKPLLLEGTVTNESNALVYETDAKLQLPNNVFLSSPTGVMVSDEQQKIFAGDMQLLTTQQTISANEAVLTLQPGGSSVLTSKTLSIASNDNSQPAMEIKGDNLSLTIPAKKTPAVPPASTPDSPTAPSPTTP